MSVFGSISSTDIGNAVNDQITDLDSKIKSLSDILSFGLNDSNYSKLYEIASDINLAIAGVCLAIACIMTYLAIVKEGLTLRSDWKKVVTILLRLAITKGLIDSSTQFVAWIYSFPDKITSIVINYTTNKSSDSILGSVFDPADVAKGFGITDDSSILSKFAALQFAKLLGFLFFLIGVGIFIIALARILKLYTMLAFSSLAFSKIPLEGFGGCKEYLKEVCALGLQGGVIAGTLCIYEVANTSIADICNTGPAGSMGSVFVLSISLILILFKSEEIARKIM